MRFLGSTIVLALALAMPAAIRGQDAPAPDRKSTWDLRLSPLMDLHFQVRRSAAGQSEALDVPGFADAVRAAREVERQLGTPLAWGLIESVMAERESADELRAISARLPAQAQLQGRAVPIRELVAKLADAYAALEPAYLESVWPRHEQEIERAKATLTDELLPRQAECLGDVTQKLNISDPGLTIPVYLVYEAPDPGAVTHRRRGGGGVCFVGISDLDGGLLLETVLHESLHALDVATQDQDTAFQSLRQQLSAAGFDPRSAELRDVPHTLMFVQAGDTIRRLFDPAHVDYGEARGYYAKLPDVAATVRAEWAAYLAGAATRQEALERIVAAVPPPPSEGASAP